MTAADLRSPSSPTKPIRLRVSFRSPEGLVSEFTRSIGRGVVAIESRKNVPIGTRFVFELTDGEAEAPVEVSGEVVQVTRLESGTHALHVRYRGIGDRRALDAMLRKIFNAHRHEQVRRHPRVPIQFRGTERVSDSPWYLVRDLSRGGARIEVEASALPRRVEIGTPFLLDLPLATGEVSLHGEVIWAFNPPAGKARLMYPAFGVSFGRLRAELKDALDRLLVLRGMPAAPWKASLSFGREAVARMP